MRIANGDFNLSIFPGTKHKNCDIAVAKVIVEEADVKLLICLVMSKGMMKV